MRIRGRRDGLERRLEAERPQPADEFVSGLSERLSAAPIPRRTGWRVALAAGFTALLVLAFALTGSIGYAASAVQGGTTAVTSLVIGPAKATKAEKKANKPQQANNHSSSSAQSSSQSIQSSSEEEDDPEDDDSSADDQYEEKVLICHIPPGNPDNAHTISISVNAVPAHLAHGDTLGACPDDGEDEN